jgi:hypothetical protein
MKNFTILFSIIFLFGLLLPIKIFVVLGFIVVFLGLVKLIRLMNKSNN